MNFLRPIFPPRSRSRSPSHSRSPSLVGGSSDLLDPGIAPPPYSYHSDGLHNTHSEKDNMKDADRLEPDHGVYVSTPPSSSKESSDDRLSLLRQYDTVIVLDDSGSMSCRMGTYTNNWRTSGKTRWETAKDALSRLAEIAGKYDADGIDIHFLNHEPLGGNLGLKDAKAVSRLLQDVQLQPITPIGYRLEILLNAYLRRLTETLQYEHVQEDIEKSPKNLSKYIKPVNYLVITDGVPTDDVRSVIRQYGRRLANISDIYGLPTNRRQVGIQLIQIDDDPAGTRELMILDDQLASDKENIPDIVDTVPFNPNEPFTSDKMIKILLGAINSMIDERK